MITFNQLKYNSFVNNIRTGIPCIRVILILTFLMISSILYWISIQMHEATIFKISGRVDFLEMPLLDRIEDRSEEWWVEDIQVVEKSQQTIPNIMKNNYFQQTPLKIKGYADFVGLAEGLNIDETEKRKYEDIKISSETMRQNYTYLRNKMIDKDLGEDKEKEIPLLAKNPFNDIFDIDNIIYGESENLFYTPASKKSCQKFICNIANQSPKGNLNISVVHPLYLRYMYLADYWTEDKSRDVSLGITRYSDLDLFNPADESGKFSNFNYTIVNHATLEPGDCFYLPSNWWVQLDNRMHIKMPGSNDPLYEKYSPEDESERQFTRWIEFEYTDLSYIEAVAIEGLERGYGS